jgi:hypothetical protein
MAVLEKVKEAVGVPTPTKPDKSVLDKIARGRKRMREDAALRKECMEFWRGNQYVFRNAENYLVKQGTVTNADGSGKPRHRVRGTHNLLVDCVATEVSAATQRIPSYEVDPSNTDADTLDAAHLSEKICIYGHDQWDIRRAASAVVTYAVVADEGFAWPYFDNQVGTPIDGEVSTGEIKIRTYSGNEVGWEPGIPFEDSRWWFVESGRPVSEVEKLPGFLGGKLAADANTSDVLGDEQKQDKLVIVTDYLERPSPSNPKGLHLTMANNRIILPPAEYPCTDHKGRPVDEPVLHRLSYFEDPGSDRGMGLVRHCLDDQRTYNDCLNKITEWKNLALMPQILAPEGSITTRITDEPGQLVEYKPGFDVPQWRPVPAIPSELFTMAEKAKENIMAVFSQNAIPNQVEAGKAIQTMIQDDAARRQSFVANLAEFYSRLSRHCLYLVQKHYTEERVIKIRGQLGFESIPAFMGADLKGEDTVRVSPASIEPQTRAFMEQRVMNLLQIGAINPEQAARAINAGDLGEILAGYDLQVKHAQRTIQKCLALGDTLDPQAPPNAYQTAAIPEPRKYDNIPVHREVLHNYFMTVDFENQPAPVKFVLNLYDQALDNFEQQKAMEQAQMQSAQAAQIGMTNAASPQPGAGGQKPLPSLPALQQA